MSHSGGYDSSKPYGVKSLLKFIIENQTSGGSSTTSESFASTARTSDSGSTSASYNYAVIGGSISWDPHAAFGRLENLSGTDSLEYQVIATSKDAPSDPNTDTSDWYTVLATQTLSAGSSIDFHESVNAEQVALGVRDGTATVDYNRHFIASAANDLVELIQGIGEPSDSSAGVDAAGSVISQLRQVVIETSDIDSSISNVTNASDQFQVSLESSSLSNNLDVDIAEASGSPLDVSASEIDVNLNTDSLASSLDVDLAEASGSPLDVSGAEVDVDLNSQTLSRIISNLELNDGAGTYAEIYQTGNAVDTNIASQDSDLGVSINSSSLSNNLDVDIAEASASPLDVSAAEVDVNLNTDSLANNLDVDLAEVSASPLDVSGAEIDVDLNSQTLTDVQTNIRGRYNSTLPSVTDGNLSEIQVDSNGRLLTNLDTELAGEDLNNDVLQVRQYLQDSGGTFGYVQRTNNSINTYLTGQSGDIDVNLNSDSLTSNLGVDIAAASGSPLDVSAAEVDVDLNSQTLSRLTSNLELNDGAGAYGEIYQTGNALDTNIASQDADVDVNLNTDSLAGDLDVDINSQTLSRVSSAIEATNGTSYGEIQRSGNALLTSIDNEPLDVSATTVTVTDNGSFTLAGNDGTVVGDVDVTQLEIPGSGSGTSEVERRGTDLKVSLEQEQLGGNLDVDIAEASGSPIEVTPPVDSGSNTASASLSDGGSISVNLTSSNADDIIYVATSDEDFQIDVTHYDSTGQAGNSITQDASSGTITAGNVNGEVVQTPGLSAQVTLNDQSSDGGNSATATLIAKAV